MTKCLNFLFVFLLFSSLVSAQNFLTLSNIEEIYNAPINKKEIKILKHGFELGIIQPTAGLKLYNKGFVYNSHYKENISFVTRKTKYNDPVGNVAYQTWVPKHYAELIESVSKKYKYLGNFKFSDGDDTFDLYEGNGFVILVYSFVSGGSNMVGNIIFKPDE